MARLGSFNPVSSPLSRIAMALLSVCFVAGCIGEGPKQLEPEMNWYDLVGHSEREVLERAGEPCEMVGDSIPAAHPDLTASEREQFLRDLGPVAVYIYNDYRVYFDAFGIVTRVDEANE